MRKCAKEDDCACIAVQYSTVLYRTVEDAPKFATIVSVPTNRGPDANRLSVYNHQASSPPFHWSNQTSSRPSRLPTPEYRVPYSIAPPSHPHLLGFASLTHIPHPS